MVRASGLLAPKKKKIAFRLFFPFFSSLRSATLLTFFTFDFHLEGQLRFHNSNTALYPIMGSGKKEASRKERQGKTSDGMSNVRTKGENFYRLVHPENTT